MTTVRVRLAEVPTDVLWLLATHYQESFTVPAIVEACAPFMAWDAEGDVRRALLLLGEAGYVDRSKARRWKVTSAGLRAISDASQQDAAEHSASPRPYPPHVDLPPDPEVTSPPSPKENTHG